MFYVACVIVVSFLLLFLLMCHVHLCLVCFICVIIYELCVVYCVLYNMCFCVCVVSCVSRGLVGHQHMCSLFGSACYMYYVVSYCGQLLVFYSLDVVSCVLKGMVSQ